MKTIVYMTLSANGIFSRPSETHQMPKEIFFDFLKLVGKNGNVVIGRKTFDLMKDQMPDGGIPGVEMVVVSNSVSINELAVFVQSPGDAVQYLSKKGFNSIIIGGGANLNNSFINTGLVDEIILTIEPVILDNGITALTGGHNTKNLHLIESSKVNDNIVRLHYKIIKQ